MNTFDEIDIQEVFELLSALAALGELNLTEVREYIQEVFYCDKHDAVKFVKLWSTKHDYHQ